MDVEPDIDDKDVWDIDREKAFMAPERIELVTKYILEHFDQKTYRGDKSYVFNVLTNISEVASAKNGAVEEIKQKQRVSGFNSIFAVASVPMAKLYYAEFKRQMEADPTKKLRIATIYSYGANEKETDGILDEENPEDTSALDQSSRDFLEAAIRDYNEMFHTNYSTDGDKFQNYYKDVSLRMKNKELDLLIVVNMFLTGFDATTLNTLWVDKNLKMHGLIQAFSRTNRILNSIKTFGNIVCFRNLQRRVDDAISLFGDKNASGIVLPVTVTPKTASDSKSLHDEIKEKLVAIGELLGFESRSEVEITTGAVVDAVWEAKIGNMGKAIYVFEVQSKGSIDSLILNLKKAQSNAAVQAVVAVADEERLAKIIRESAGVIDEKSLRTWNSDDVLAVYDSLARAHESINKLALVPESF